MHTTLQFLKPYLHTPRFLFDNLHAITYEHKTVVKAISCMVIALVMVPFSVSITISRSSYFKKYHSTQERKYTTVNIWQRGDLE